jgi:hypothetical protein
MEDGATFANPAFVHQINMNDGSDEEEIDVDALTHRDSFENPVYESMPVNGRTYAGSGLVTSKPSMAPLKVYKRDTVTLMLSVFAILLSLIAIVIALGVSFNEVNTDCCDSRGGDGATAAASSAGNPLGVRGRSLVLGWRGRAYRPTPPPLILLLFLLILILLPPPLPRTMLLPVFECRQHEWVGAACS